MPSQQSIVLGLIRMENWVGTPFPSFQAEFLSSAGQVLYHSAIKTSTSLPTGLAQSAEPLRYILFFEQHPFKITYSLEELQIRLRLTVNEAERWKQANTEWKVAQFCINLEQLVRERVQFVTGADVLLKVAVMEDRVSNDQREKLKERKNAKQSQSLAQFLKTKQHYINKLKPMGKNVGKAKRKEQNVSQRLFLLLLQTQQLRATLETTIKKDKLKRGILLDEPKAAKSKIMDDGEDQKLLFKETKLEKGSDAQNKRRFVDRGPDRLCLRELKLISPQITTFRAQNSPKQMNQLFS